MQKFSSLVAGKQASSKQTQDRVPVHGLHPWRVTGYLIESQHLSLCIGIHKVTLSNRCHVGGFFREKGRDIEVAPGGDGRRKEREKEELGLLLVNIAHAQEDM